MINWNKVLTRKDVIKLLKISEATYKIWLKKGFLAKIKRRVGNQCLFDKDEIMAELGKMREE